MRATCSDNLVIEDCFVPAELVFDELLIPNIGEFMAASESVLNLPYTAVYMGVGLAMLEAVTTNVQQRQPPGYTQPLAYHPDIRRRVALMSAHQCTNRPR
jgi:alkylation response protein AidB-like acyl-CoA dehydrogenase